MNKSVLIAEDEPYIVQSLTFLLEREGLDVDVATDGAQAMDSLKQSVPDLVLLDIMMEHFTGFDILSFIRAEPRLAQIKVLVLTAKGQEGDRRKAMELGANRFIAKPYANKDVVDTVLALLNE